MHLKTDDGRPKSCNCLLHDNLLMGIPNIKSNIKTENTGFYKNCHFLLCLILTP